MLAPAEIQHGCSVYADVIHCIALLFQVAEHLHSLLQPGDHAVLVGPDARGADLAPDEGEGGDVAIPHILSEIFLDPGHGDIIALADR